MSMLIGGGIAAVVALGYVGRKGWLAFHRAVGISPGKMTYADPAQLPPPVMIQLTLSEVQLQQLPPIVVEQLTRIDTKADMYQAWKADLAQSGQTPAANEDEFIVSKLLSHRLPEMIDNYLRIARHENRLQETQPLQANKMSSTNQPNSPTSLSLKQAMVLLLSLLNQTESKLDDLLKGYRNNSLQDMQAMNRYLKER